MKYPNQMKAPTFCLPAAILLGTASISQSANILKLATGDYDAGSGWDGGVVPSTGDIGVFDATSVPTGAGASFDASSNTYIGGLVFTDIAGPVTISGGNPAIYGSGIDMSASAADVTFTGTFRYGAGTTITVGTGRTLSLFNTTTLTNIYTVGVNGGGTLAVNGTMGGNGSNRLAWNVTGTGTTLAGTGTYRPNNSNAGYGIQMNDGTVMSPGNGGIGTLTIDSGSSGGNILRMLSGSSFQYQLGTGGTFALPGNGDLLVLANAAASDLVFNNNVINFLGTGSAGIFKLFDTSLDATTWSGLTLSGQQITGGLSVSNLGSGLSGNLYLGDGAGNGDLGDIYIQVVPEPSAAALGGLGMLALLRRRRR